MKLSLEDARILMEESGGNLYLRGTGITALPDNLTVGGWLDLRGTGITKKKIKYLREGDYVEGRYLYADGILTHVKKRKKSGAYTYFVGKIPNKNVVFDGVNFAHCSNFRDGISDLLFKAAKDRGAEQYKGIPLDDPIPIDEMKTMYRVITGACQQGTQAFIDSLGASIKEQYTVREVISLTKVQYGGECFREFFEQ